MSESATEPTAPESGTDWKAEAEKWKRFAREWEDRAKSKVDADALKAAEARAEAAEGKVADLTAKALRADVARAKGLTDAQAKRLTGTTREELEADADDLLEAFGGKKPETKEEPKDDPKPDAEPTKDETKEEPKVETAARPPREALKPGAANGDSDDFDAASIADRLRSRNSI